MSGGDSARLARRTALAGAAVLVGIGVAGWLAWRPPRLEPVELSPQTSYLLQPTGPEGWVDYAAAVDWMRRASLDGGGANAAEPLMRALGPIGRPPVSGARAARAVLDRWRSDAGPPAETSELEPLRDTGGARSPADGDASAVDDWLRARCPARGDNKIGQAQIDAWLAQSGAALANLLEASRAKGLYVPATRNEYTTTFERLNPFAMADAAGVMRCAAAAKLLRGDPPGSWEDVEAMWRLGLLLGRSSAFAEYRAARSLWGKALGATVDLAASPATSRETLVAMQKSLGALADFPPATEPLLISRLFMLDALTAAVRGRPPARTETGLLLPIGSRAGLVELNGDFDALEAALQAPDPRQRLARLDQVAAAGKYDRGARNMLGDEIRARSSRRLASIALALVLRRRETGALAASLADLGELPKDPGSGEPFRYAPSGRQFRLYGVGVDGRDDGGDPKKDEVVTATEPPRLVPPS